MKFSDPQVNFYVADVGRVAKFYVEMFGFTETFRTPRQGDPVHVELRIGTFILGIASRDAIREMHGFDIRKGPPQAEVTLWTDNVDETYNVLIQKGVHSLSAPHDFISSLRAAWIADPEGNPVQLVQKIG